MNSPAKTDSAWVHFSLTSAGNDLISNLATALSVTNNAAPTSLSYLEPFGPHTYCLNERLGGSNPFCTAVPPDVLDSEPGLFLANGTIITPSSSADIPTNYTGAISNAMQLVLAAARLDMGNIFPNNFLIYSDVINATIASDLPVQGAPSEQATMSELYGALQDGIQGSALVSLSNNVLEEVVDVSQPAVIDTQYLCHFSQAKPMGQAFISVLVATLSMFSGGWAVFLLISTYFEKRRYQQGVGQSIVAGSLFLLES